MKTNLSMALSEKVLLALGLTYIIFLFLAFIFAIMNFYSASDIIAEMCRYIAPFIIGWATGIMTGRWLMSR